MWGFTGNNNTTTEPLQDYKGYSLRVAFKGMEIIHYLGKCGVPF